MPGSSIRIDSSRLSRADVTFHRLEALLNGISGAAILLLVCVATVNVLGRKLFNLPLPGFIDWVEQFLAVFAFFGLAYCQRLGGHIRMDIVIGQFRGRRLWLAEVLSTLLLLFLATVLLYGSWHHFLRSLDFSSPLWSRDSSIDIALPLWPAKLIVPLSICLLWLRLILQLWGYGRAFRQNAKLPVAVPMVLDAGTVASQEIDAVGGTDGRPA